MRPKATFGHDLAYKSRRRDKATAMPSTSTFQAGLLRPPTTSVLAGLWVPSTAARPARTLATSAGSRTIVVIFTKFSISIPEARSCACKFRHANAHCASASSGELPSAAMPIGPLIERVRLASVASIAWVYWQEPGYIGRLAPVYW